ncbi:hypothetical protein [Bradyrhizobium sp. WSM3983]|uniref:hypothetical protein n=1 Tax=Bradyrhizobium sp. WSM3983 TaxID=1038867 RepID=UPI00041226FC|nr:hypothetical protein [Bradyrhizobium sp. WSM3983]
MAHDADRPFADPEVAARKLLEFARGIEPIHDGRIYIEQINYPTLFKLKASPAEYKAGARHCARLDRAKLHVHESGTFVRLLQGARDQQ